jgi:hypothetical protein
MRVRSPSSRGSEQLTGEVRLQVGREDITNLNVPLSRLTDIQMFEGGPVIAGWMGVELHSSDGRVISSERDQQGEIWFRAVEPGSYRVVSFPIDACVTSLSSGGLDLLQHELVVTSGASIDPIQVAGGPGCASLTVTTNYKTTCDAQRTDLMLVCTSAAIVVTSNLKGFEPRLFGAEGMPLPSRQPALPEGEYQFYAFDNVTNLEYANTEVLRKFKSQTVFLHAGQTASIQLAVNKRPTL